MHWWRTLRPFLPLVAAFLAGALVVGTVSANRPNLAVTRAASVTFSLVQSTGAAKAGCLAGAMATGTLTDLGPVQNLTIAASGLPHNVVFNTFIIQIPDAPFGNVWYQGDVVTDASGYGTQTFVGIFDSETFTAAPGVAPAPQTHTAPPFPDATVNLGPSNPVHMYHVGLWFDSFTDAQAAGCPSTETFFSGAHTAGIQALSTRTYAANNGPLLLCCPPGSIVALPAIFNRFKGP